MKVPDTLKRYLLTFSRNKQPKDLLLGAHDRDWPRHWVKKICRLARVPEVCAHPCAAYTQHWRSKQARHLMW